ncbi:hypothetical protein DFH06DRAFT_1129849 [Mycena polygramma]|nr:hypothetical protein DFH06DRAFT_1129849 [Mycena polygramma]
MHFFPGLVAFLVAVSISTHAKCYNSGEKWDPLFAEQDVRDAARFFGGGATGKSWPHGKEVEHTNKTYVGRRPGLWRRCHGQELASRQEVEHTVYHGKYDSKDNAGLVHLKHLGPI